MLRTRPLALTPDRRFEAAPVPRWRSSIPPTPEGEKHPVARGFSERLVKAHSALLRCVAKRVGAGANDWPVLITEVSPERSEMLAALHRLCDWVVTVDRHAGVEYFDSPRDLPSLYEAYLIDCVPERDDLGFLQLITSTSSLDEIVRLLDTALGEMGLSASPRNCTFLLDALKALSGRLALRLTQSASAAQEMVALALTQNHCALGGEESAPWFSLTEGFFVPLDDVPVWLFGPARLPETQRGAMPLGEGISLLEAATPLTAQDEANAVEEFPPPGLLPTAGDKLVAGPKAVELLLGQRDGSDEPVRWQVSIQGNPHLLIVGLPGMGKTTCLIQMCRELM